MIQALFDMLRGAFAMSLGVVAFAFIVWLIVPGMSFDPEPAARLANRARSMTALFGGIGVIIVVIIFVGVYFSRQS